MVSESENTSSAMFIIADRVYGGNLRSQLQAWRTAGVSLRAIQRLLAVELGTTPALETVRRWVQAAEANGEAA